jgi:hypothetical protein
LDELYFSDDTAVMANTYSTIGAGNKRNYHWYLLCDTTIGSLENYGNDIWTEVDIFHGSIQHDRQRIVFGDGAMGNEGFVASTTEAGDLNWALFSTFSNPICRAKIADNHLLCYGDSGIEITIDLHCLTTITVKSNDFFDT